MTQLTAILNECLTRAQTEREKGTYAVGFSKEACDPSQFEMDGSPIPTLKKGEERAAFRGISSDKFKVTSSPGPFSSGRRGEEGIFRVEKMRHPKIKENGKSVDDKTTLIYNDHITVRDIPTEAYDYVVNGKPALAWAIERQCVKTDKDSGIVNDANQWATETMNNPAYPLELFLRVITVSLKTMKIVNRLPSVGG